MDGRDKYLSQDVSAFGFSLDVFQLDVASLNLEFVKKKYMLGDLSPHCVFSSPILMYHVWFIRLQACHLRLHKFVVRAKLLAPTTTCGPCCR